MFIITFKLRKGKQKGMNASIPQLNKLLSMDSQEEVEDEEQEKEEKTNEGQWALEENVKYTYFMAYFKHIFISKQRRKSAKIFKSLSQYLKTRSPRQCRSHFQKLILKHKTISKMRSYFRNMLGKEIYDEQYKQFCQQIQSAQHLHPMLKHEGTVGEKMVSETGVQTEGILPMMGHEQWGTSQTIEEPSYNLSNVSIGFWAFMPPFPQKQVKEEQ